MRKAYDGEIWEVNNEIIGLNLGADFVSEHEWGIDSIKYICGIGKNDVDGVDRYAITKKPNILFNTKDACSAFCLKRSVFDDRKETAFSYIDDYMIQLDEKQFNAAWNSSNFLIHSSDTKIKEFLGKLKEAFVKKDVVIFTGASGVFKNGGLVVAIKSKLPQEFKDKTLKQHLDTKKLYEYFRETGIENKLKNKGKRYMALSPRWGRADEIANSDYKIMCWLNPHDQQNNQYGWYTIEELLLWADDRGPIPVKI